MNTQNEAKQKAAQQALEFINSGCVLGVGTGSTVRYLIEALPQVRGKIETCVSSSADSTARLKALHFEVIELNQVSQLDVYIDGADEVDPHKNLIKGGGAALTFEKLLAVNAKSFVCIVDPSKCVPHLGQFPLPIEVLPVARSYVARELLKITKGQPLWREGVVTDSGNVILDVLHPQFPEDLIGFETLLQSITGVVEVGLFAKRRPDHILVGG